MNNLICQLIISHKKIKIKNKKINTQINKLPTHSPTKKFCEIYHPQKISESGICVSLKTTHKARSV